MCLLYGRGATAIWCDTGAEHKELYERIDYVENMLMAYHEGEFKLLRLRANVTVGEGKVDSLTDYIYQSKYMPSAQARFCTRLFKIEPIDRFLAAQGDCELMIGLNYDEAEQRTGNHGLQPNVRYTYPLVDSEMNREDCKDVLEHYGLLPDFQPYMARGGCKYCFFKSKKEYAAMVHLDPETMEEIQRLEEHIQDNRNKYFRIKSNMPRLRDFIATERANLIGDLSEFYTDDSERKSCGVFCHR